LGYYLFGPAEAPVTGPVPPDDNCQEFGTFSLRAGVVGVAVESEKL
jgi:hypothetical protein